eukprot:327740_1
MEQPTLSEDIGITVLILIILGLLCIHCIYGIRFRCTNLSQKADALLEKRPLLLPGSMKNGNTVTILSQNLWCVFLIGGSNRRARLQLFIKKIDDEEPDIICLQEMNLFGIGFLIVCGDYLFLERELFKRGFIYHTDPKLLTPYFGSSSGLVVFSKYKIAESTSTVFKHRRCARYKGFITARITLKDGKQLTLINTHLEHKDGGRIFRQIGEIVKDKNVVRDDGAFKVCLGDFNICSNGTFGGDSYSLLSEYMAQIDLNYDLFDNTDRTYSKSFTRKGTESLDHMFVNDKLRQFVDEFKTVDYKDDDNEIMVSDHLALV